MLGPRPETIRGRGDTEASAGGEGERRSAGEKLLKVNTRAEIFQSYITRRGGRAAWRPVRICHAGFQPGRLKRHDQSHGKHARRKLPRQIRLKANYVSTLRCDRSGASGALRENSGSTRDLVPRWAIACQEANEVWIKTLDFAP